MPRFLIDRFVRDRRAFAPDGDGATPPAGDTPPAAPPAATLPPAAAPGEDTPPAPPAGDTPPGGEAPAAKWWEGLSDPHKAYLTPKGLTVDDPLQALPKLIDIAANAEKRIGKGLDSIIDRPAKGQDYGEWARANAEALGLPADAAGYEVKPPSDWPKDLPWDSAAEGAAREIALKHGVPKAAHDAYVTFQADAMKRLAAEADAGSAKAKAEMMAELQRDWGGQVQAKVTLAQQAAQVLAEKAGLTSEGVEALSQTLSAKTGDAGVIRIFAAVAEMMGDDSGFAMGRGAQTLGTTPAEARAEIARFESADGEYGKAFKAGDQVALAGLKAKRDQLYKLAAG